MAKTQKKRNRRPDRALPTQREMLFGMKGGKPVVARQQPEPEEKKKTSSSFIARAGYDEQEIARQLGASYAVAMGKSAPPEVVAEIIREAKRKKKPAQVRQLIARFVPGSPKTIVDQATAGYWIVPKKVTPEQIQQPCTPEQLEWAKACVRASRKAKKLKTSASKRWRAVTRDYLATL